MNQIKDKSTRESQDTYGHVLKYTGLFGGVQGLKVLMNVIRTKLTSIFLGGYGMGLNAIFQNIGELANSSTNLGVAFSSLRNISELFEEGNDEDIRRFLVVIRTWCLWTAILGSMVCLVGAPFFAHYFFPVGSSHIKEIILLSAMVFSMPIEAGECAILKGLRQLKRVAKVEVYATISVFLLTVPIYYFIGVYGIAISLVCCGWAIALIHLYYCTQLFPYRVSLLSREVFRAGIPLVKIGIPYVLASIVTAAATSMIFSTFSDPTEVGHYKAGYGLMVTYAGMVFVALETDFFPRLSSVNHDSGRMNFIINQQIDVCISLITPLLILLALCMPWVIRLLLTREFMDIKYMCDAAVFFMFFRAITTPIAYSALAKGDSLIYFTTELIYNIVFVLIMRFSYATWGLTGSGIALSLIALFDLVMISSTYSIIYRYRMRGSTLQLIIPQFLTLAVVVLACFLVRAVMIRYSICLIALFVSTWLSWRVLSHDREMMDKLSSKFTSLFAVRK